MFDLLFIKVRELQSTKVKSIHRLLNKDLKTKTQCLIMAWNSVHGPKMPPTLLSPILGLQATCHIWSKVFLLNETSLETVESVPITVIAYEDESVPLT